MSSDPFDPAKNIPAGVNELQAELRQTGYLRYALEAYNSGSGGPGSTDTAYPAVVQSYLTAYEAGPAISTWSTADYSTKLQEWQMAKGQQVRLVVAATGPYGQPFSMLWKPSHGQTCTTVQVKDPKTGKLVPRTTCRPNPPQTLTGHDLVQPASSSLAP